MAVITSLWGVGIGGVDRLSGIGGIGGVDGLNRIGGILLIDDRKPFFSIAAHSVGVVFGGIKLLYGVDNLGAVIVKFGQSVEDNSVFTVDVHNQVGSFTVSPKLRIYNLTVRPGQSLAGCILPNFADKNIYSLR